MNTMTSVPTIICGNSTIRGKENTSIHGKKYYSFLGIPYAEPPIKEQRFLAPQQKELPEIIEAIENKNCAIQFHLKTLEIMGSEDCLYLDIYIPDLPSEKSRPVIFFIHGGAHYRFNKNGGFSPSILIENDVIIVTINYRLHIFGFLNLGIPECPGNAGCKDLVCGLRWVKKYIKYFGGDPDNITLMGISSGASMAHLMTLSPLCKNMFKRVISCGGHAISPWNFTNSPIETAYELGEILGFKKQDKKELCKFLKSCSAETICTGFQQLFYKQSNNLIKNWFLPSVEFIADDAFLPENPFNLIEKTDPISMIFGISEFEGVLLWAQKDFPTNCTLQDLEIYMKTYIKMEQENFDAMFKEVVQFYESSYKSTVICLWNLLSDLFLINHYTKAEILQNNSCAFYLYKFTFCGNGNLVKKAYNGVTHNQQIEVSFHGDEIGYIAIPATHLFDEADFKISNTICSYLTNFARSGNPNCSHLDCVWMPSTSKNECYIELGAETKMISHSLNSERAKFWIYLKNKYLFE